MKPASRITIPSFISCYTCPEILDFQGFLPFSIFLLHIFQGMFDAFGRFDLFILGHTHVRPNQLLSAVCRKKSLIQANIISYHLAFWNNQIEFSAYFLQN